MVSWVERKIPNIGTVFRFNEQIVCTGLRKQHSEDYFVRMHRDTAVNLLRRAEAAPVIGQMLKELYLAVNDPALLPAIQDARADIAWRITKSFIGNGYLFGPIGTMLDCTEMRTWDWETTGKSKMEVPGALRDIVFSHLKSKEWREFVDMTLRVGLGFYDASASIRPDPLVECLVRFEPDGRTRRSDPQIPSLSMICTTQ